MKDLASRAGIGVAVAAAVLSIVSASFVPFAYPWPSVAWAVLACAAAVWVAKRSLRARPSMKDVISGVEAESPRAVAVPER